MPVIEGHTKGSSGGTTSVTCTVPAGVVDGELLVLLLSRFRPSVSGGPVVLSGWTKHSEHLTGFAGISVFSRPAASEPASYTPTWDANSKPTWIMVRISGADSLDVVSFLEDGSPGTTMLSPSINVVDDGSLLLSAVSGQGNFEGNLTHPSGTTLVDSIDPGGGSSQTLAIAHEDADSGATGTRTWTFPSSTRGVGCTISVVPAAGSGTNQDGDTSDAVAFSESLQAGVSKLGSALDALTFQDASAALKGLSGSLSDVLALNEALDGAVGVPVLDLASWEPVAGHSAYEWQEGAMWTDIDVATLGITEATADFGPIIKAHIDDSANRELRLRYVFPAGTFTLATVLQMNRDQKRIVGAGIGQTVFEYVLDGAINFAGGDGSTTNIVGSPSRGATQISVADASVATVGETIVIKQTADDTVTCVDDNTSPYAVGTIPVETCAEDPYGQIVEVTAVDTGANTISFTPALALDYDSGKSPYAKRFNNVYDCGIEGLTIDVTLDTGDMVIEFDRARQCYAKDVKVINFAKSAINCRESFEVEVSGCVLRNARNTGSGGNGYGVSCELHSTRIYIHDNRVSGIIRHAFLLQTSASHCIVAYNYVDTASVENLTDLSIHGHYTHHNLIEGNIFHGCIEINDFYPQTMQNVVFRNKILGNASFWDTVSRDFAFWVRRKSLVAIAGNRCLTNQVARVFDCSEGSLIELNGQADAPAAWMGESRYLSGRPADWGGGYVWPPFAGNDDNRIPAEDLPIADAYSGGTSDALGYGEGFSLSAAMDAAVIDSVNFASSVLGLLSMSARVSDVVELGALNAVTRHTIAAVRDSVAYSNERDKAAVLSDTLADSWQLTEFTDAVSALAAHLSDELAVNDELRATLAEFAAMSDGLTFGELIAAIVQLPTGGLARDGLVFGESFSALVASAISVSDGLSVSEAAGVVSNAVTGKSDVLAFDDVGTGLISAVIAAAVSESLSFSSARSVSLVLQGSVSHGVLMSDSRRASYGASQRVTDGILFADALGASVDGVAGLIDSLVYSDGRFYPSEVGMALGVVAITLRTLGTIAAEEGAKGEVQIIAHTGGTVKTND